MYRRAQPVQPDSAGRHARVAPHQTSYCSGTVGWQVNSADQHQLPHSVCHWTSGCGMTQEVFLVTRFDWRRNNHDFAVAPTSRFCVSCTELMRNKKETKEKKHQWLNKASNKGSTTFQRHVMTSRKSNMISEAMPRLKVISVHRVAYLPYSIHPGKKVYIKSHWKVQSSQKSIFTEENHPPPYPLRPSQFIKN